MQSGKYERWNKISTGRGGGKLAPYTVAELMLAKQLLYQETITKRSQLEPG